MAQHYSTLTHLHWTSDIRLRQAAKTVTGSGIRRIRFVEWLTDCTYIASSENHQPLLF